MGKTQYVNYWFGHAAGPQNAAGVPDDVRTIKFTIKKNRFFDEHRVFGRKFFRFSPIKSEIQDPALHRLVWNVPTTSIDDASVIHNEIPGVAVSRNNGPGLMITPMISGCTFICTPIGHAVLMAHVKPKEGEGGRLHGLVKHGTINIRGGRDVAGTGSFGKGTGTLGRNEYNTFERSTLIGVRTQEKWCVFAKVQSAQDKTKGKILRVVEFFNG